MHYMGNTLLALDNLWFFLSFRICLGQNKEGSTDTFSGDYDLNVVHLWQNKGEILFKSIALFWSNCLICQKEIINLHLLFCKY